MDEQDERISVRDFAAFMAAAAQALAEQKGICPTCAAPYRAVAVGAFGAMQAIVCGCPSPYSPFLTKQAVQ